MPKSNEQFTPGVSWHEKHALSNMVYRTVPIDDWHEMGRKASRRHGNNYLLLLQPYRGDGGVGQIRLGKGQGSPGLRSVQDTVTIAVCSLEQGLQGGPVD